MKKLFIFICLVLFIKTNAQQSLDSFKVTNTSRVYGLTFKPSGYNVSKKYPLVINLAGAGEVGTTISSVNNLITSSPRNIAGRIADGWNGTVVNPKTGIRESFIICTPQAASWGITYQQLKFILPDIIARYSIDESRIYLVGLSAGGGGVNTVLGSMDTAFISKFAAFATASSAGVSNTSSYTDVQVEANLQYCKARVWTFAGEQDFLLTTDVTYHNSINKGGKGKLTIISGVGHAAWGNAYDTLFRPTLNYYGTTANCNNGCVSITAPNTNGSSIRGSGVTQDSLNLFEWFLLYSTSPLNSSRVNIIAGSDGGYYNTLPIKAGDTVVLKGNYDYVTFNDIIGTKSKPITLITDGNVFIKKQLAFNSCQYWNVIGDKITIQPYGKDTIYNGWFALSITDTSKCLDISGIKISNAGIGVNVKNEPNCDPLFQYPHFIMDSIFLHDMTVKNTWNQGFYIGNTAPDNAPAPYYSPRPVICNGVTTYPRPFRMGKIKVYNCIIDSTGRAGIQLSSGSGGISEIYNNIISHSGIGGDDAQGSGIVLGAYTKAIVYGNKVNNTFTYGISSFGGVNFQFKDNIIDSSGYLNHYYLWKQSEGTFINLKSAQTYQDTLPYPYGIFICSRTLLEVDSVSFVVQNNNFGLTKNAYKIGLADYNNTFKKKGNIICSNNPNTIKVEEVIPVYYISNCNPLGLPIVENTTEKKIPFIVYPNPTKQFVNVVFDKIPKETSYYLYNVNGQLIDSERINSTNIIIPMNYTKGIYFLHINSYVVKIILI